MEKAGFTYKLPDMSKARSQIDRGPKPPNGEFRLEIIRTRPLVTQAGATAIVVEARVQEIASQTPTQDFKTKEEIPALVVGQRVDVYMQFGGQYEYGEKEWAGLMGALGVPVEERNTFQDAALGEENLAAGQQFWMRRQAPKTFFFPVAQKA